MLNTEEAIEMRACLEDTGPELPENEEILAIEQPPTPQPPEIQMRQPLQPQNQLAIPSVAGEMPKQNQALVPLTPQAAPPSPDFDLQALLKEFKDDNDTNNDLVLASTMLETQNNNARAAMVKKYSPKKNAPQFNNCKIGTINIHIHKH